MTCLASAGFRTPLDNFVLAVWSAPFAFFCLSLCLLFSFEHLFHQYLEFIQREYTIVVLVSFHEDGLESFYLVFNIETPLAEAQLTELRK